MIFHFTNFATFLNSSLNSVAQIGRFVINPFCGPRFWRFVALHVLARRQSAREQAS